MQGRLKELGLFGVKKTSVRPGVADKYHEVVITEEAQSLGLQHGCALSISEGFKTQLDEGLSNLI